MQVKKAQATRQKEGKEGPKMLYFLFAGYLISSRYQLRDSLLMVLENTEKYFPPFVSPAFLFCGKRIIKNPEERLSFRRVNNYISE
jgi:hypothetical protein